MWHLISLFWGVLELGILFCGANFDNLKCDACVVGGYSISHVLVTTVDTFSREQ